MRQQQQRMEETKKAISDEVQKLKQNNGQTQADSETLQRLRAQKSFFAVLIDAELAEKQLEEQKTATVDREMILKALEEHSQQLAKLISTKV